MSSKIKEIKVNDLLPGDWVIGTPKKPFEEPYMILSRPISSEFGYIQVNALRSDKVCQFIMNPLQYRSVLRV